MTSQDIIVVPADEPTQPDELSRPDGSGAPYDIDELDADFVPQPPHRTGRITLALSAALLIAAGLLGGVLIQKNRASSSGATARNGAFAGANFPAFGGGEFSAGLGRRAGASGTGAGGTGTDTPGDQAATPSQIPAVIGTVASIKKSSLVVRNFGDKSINVTVTATTQITTRGLNHPLKTGDQVVVVGTTASDGTVTATSITVR